VELMTRLAREHCLKECLTPLKPDYDFVLIDTPPSLGLLTLNALVAADEAVVPIQCEYYALEGVSQLMRTVDLVSRRLNPALRVGLVIMTMYDNRVRLSQQVVDEVRRVFGERVSATLVPRNVRLSEAPSHGRPIALYDPRSRGAVAYRHIAQEVIRHV
jgi:chromosome partitioning protein